MEIKDILKKRILLLDGAMGTSIQAKNLSAKDFGGDQLDGCNENLNLTRPDVISEIYESYLIAGADIISTNTFGATSVTLQEYGLEAKDLEINTAAATLAVKAAKKYSTPEKPRFVAGSLGPTNKTISVTQNITFEELQESYYREAKALFEAGVDILLIETIFDTLNAKAALNGVYQLFDEKKKKLPIVLSATIELNGRMLAGQDIESFYEAMSHHDLLAIGMNCATGPDHMRDHLRTLSSLAKTNVFCYPNAGLPLEDGTFPLQPQEFAELISDFVSEGWLNLVGGCCGSTAEHIEQLAKKIDTSKVRSFSTLDRSAVSGAETLVLEEDNRPVIVGERTNVIGSRKFKELMVDEKYDTAAEVGIAQKNKGAQVLDICLANPDRDEIKDTIEFYDRITKKVRLPIMIDSTDPKVIEVAFKRTQGKSILNSINFEDGVERIEQIMPLIKRYGAAIIFGTIDEDKEQAMAITAERKFAIAKRAYDYLVNEWGVNPYDIIFDPLVFPIATGDQKYKDSAAPTIDAIAKIKAELPGAKTILGVSNISFGLPPAGREVLNAVYLYHTTKAGLDYAIVNSEKLMRYASISDEEKKLAEDLLFCRLEDPITPFSDFYREKKVQSADMSSLPLAERLQTYIIEGRKDGLIEDLEEARKDQSPMEIINGPLIDGMSEVGRLFNNNELIVSEVLQSAEAMKAAVSHLEQFMEKKDTASKGTILLATVKGDVHDIGKNLLEIILTNNGYNVINLGIKVPPDVLIDEYNKHKPDIIGLSGLLVKSAQMMVTTAEDFKKAGLSVPIIVGGAALTRKFTALKIQPAYGHLVAYAHDAMKGLDNIGQILKDPQAYMQSQEKFEGEITERKVEYSTSTKRSSIITVDKPLIASDLSAQLLTDVNVSELFSLINPIMLYNKHLGLKRDITKQIEKGDEKAIQLKKNVDEVKKYILENNLIKPKAKYQFYSCKSENNSIQILDNNKVIETLPFPRQKGEDELCASDFVSEKQDTIAFFVTGCGEGIMEKCTELREQGEYLKSHILQILALECAEALAELVHKKIRAVWGIDADISKEDMFAAKYQGIRLSYGYPACPDLNEQKKLFDLLKPQEIGVNLTEGMMMEPEASVSAIVFHHPQAKYFKV